jgi:hypothetical protein
MSKQGDQIGRIFAILAIGSVFWNYTISPKILHVIKYGLGSFFGDFRRSLGHFLLKYLVTLFIPLGSIYLGLG